MFHRTIWLVVARTHWSDDVGDDADDSVLSVQEYEARHFDGLKQDVDAALTYARMGVSFGDFHVESRGSTVFVANSSVYNHPRGAPEGERLFFKKISELAPHTYGVCYMISDEPGPCFGRYFVMKLKNGTTSESYDVFFDDLFEGLRS